MIVMYFFLSIYINHVYCNETASPLKIARKNLIDEIVKNPRQPGHHFKEKLIKFATEHQLDTTKDYDIKTFKSEMIKMDKTVVKGECELIFAYFCNHVLHQKRSIAWEQLIKKMENAVDLNVYEKEMRDFLSKFFIEEDELSENQLKTLIVQREPSIKLDSIPKDFYEKYQRYEIMKKIEDTKRRFLLMVENEKNKPINEFEDSIDQFQMAFEITNPKPTAEELRNHLIEKLPGFETESSFDDLIRIYLKYNDYRRCLEVRNKAVNIYEEHDDPPYYLFRQPMMDFVTICGLENEYIDGETFWKHVNLIDPTFELHLAKALIYYYRRFRILFDRENAKKELDKKIDQSIYDEDFDKLIKIFITAFDLSLEPMVIEELKPLLEEIKISQDQIIDGTQILQKFNEYVNYQDIKNKIELLMKKIEIKDIKSFELKKEMEDFIKVIKIQKEQKFTMEEFIEYIKNLIQTVLDDQLEEIWIKYNQYLEYQKREDSRIKLLELIKADQKFLTKNHLKELKDFKDLHFTRGDDCPVFKDFDRELRETDGIEEEDSQLLFPFYANYLVYKEKETARNKVLELCEYGEKEMHIYLLKDSVKEFIKTHYLDFEKTLSEEDFDKYLKDQDLEIIEREQKVLYDKYIEYLKYIEISQNLANLIAMINDGKKMSEMKKEFAIFVRDFDVNRGLVDKEYEFGRVVVYRDPSFQSVNLPSLQSKTSAYFYLIERIFTKEKLIEFLNLNPNPKSLKLKVFINPFIKYYNLKYYGFSKFDQFYSHLQKQEDDITEEESKTLFKYYQIFSKINQRWNTRDALYEFLEKESQLTISQLFPLVDLFASAYQLTHYHFTNMEEFRVLAQSKDETFDEKYATGLYASVVKYFEFLNRVQKRKALIDFQRLRTDATVYQLDAYVNQVLESYSIHHGLLSDFDSFKDHIRELDYTISTQEAENLYRIVLDHILIMDRIKIKESTLEMLSVCIEEYHPHVTTSMALLANSYQLAGKSVSDLNQFYNSLAEKDPTVTLEEANKLYLHYLQYLESANRKIVRAALLGYIGNTQKISYQGLSEYIVPYIKSHGFLSHELYKYERFYIKGKVLDQEISDSEIETIWKAVQIFIKSPEFKDEQDIILSHNDVIYTHEFITPTGINGVFYALFRHFGVYPHYIPNHMTLEDLSSHQKSFAESYRYFTGVDYFQTRNELIFEEKNDFNAKARIKYT